jgi:serpin B
LLPLSLAVGLNAAGIVAPGINQFATTAYHELARGDQNLIFSPFNIATALSMLLEGARGDTADEIAAVVHQAQHDPEYQAGLSGLVDELIKQGNAPGNQLLMGNALWVQRGFPLLPSFQDALRTNFQAPATPVDFSGALDQTRREINNWTEQQTKGRIKDLFPPGSIAGDTRLVLTSAIYFYGKWQFAFAVKDTQPALFRGPAGQSEAKFMNKTASFGYSETADLQILEMKYAGTPIAFDVLLPKQDKGLPALEKSLTATQISDWVKGLQRRSVQVAMPKFRVESEFSLKGMLTAMGMRMVFTPAADLSGIDGKRDLYVSAVKHKAFVDVSEEGTEAAAATGTVVALASMPLSKAVFRADHPFLFFVRDTSSGAIMFAGRVVKP